MKFWLDGLEVYFPYTYIYPEQYQYMYRLKQALDAGGACVLEMPSGTGKTVSLLSLITSYQAARPTETPKLIYCSRTIQEIEKVLEEAKRVLAYREKEMGANAPRALCVGLSSRKNLCIHPEVSEERDGNIVDSKCRSLTMNWIREREKAKPNPEQRKLCPFFEGFEEGGGKDAVMSGVLSLADLRELGLQKGWCPYFLARKLVNMAQIVVFSYQYILDPRIADIISKSFPGDSIVVFDEAHNIDNVCIDALSVSLTRQTLEASTRNITTLSNNLQRIRVADEQRLTQEYQRLLEGLAQPPRSTMADDISRPPVLPQDLLEEAVPGNIRRAEHFVGLLRRFVEHLKHRLRAGQQVVSESPLLFCRTVEESVVIESRHLRFCTARLGMLLRSMEEEDTSQFTPLNMVADFATLVSTYTKGFTVLIEPADDRNPYYTIQICCLDASLALRPVLNRFRSVVITSGTISPLDIYPKILNFQPVVSERFPMTLYRNCVCPLIITRGSDQLPISSKYEARDDPAVVRNYGNILVEFTTIVPDGIVCFFTSYAYMEGIIATWNDMGLLKAVLKHKLLFIETPDPLETTLALANYRKACDSGRGAVLFSVARGKVSEGIDFDHHYGRAVLLFGIPYVYTESIVLRARLEYLRDTAQIKESEFLTFDAMRQAAQCVGRVIRGKSDYGIMVWADKRYNRSDKRSKMPQWISQFLTEVSLNLSTDMAVNLAKSFLREMAQPTSKEDEIGKSLWTLEHVLRQPASRPPMEITNGESMDVPMEE